MAATNAALRTYELLETILIYLPPLDTIKARAVSKSWYSVISSSIWLRQAIFLEKPTAKPLRFDPSCRIRADLWFASLQGDHLEVAPLFNKTRNPKRSRTLNVITISSLPDSKFYVLTCPVRLQAELSRVDVWSSMYLTRPPCTAIIIMIPGDGGAPFRGVPRTSATLVDRQGIRLGLVAQTLTSMLTQVGGAKRAVLAFRITGKRKT